MDPAQPTPLEALDLAVTRAGSQSALARICGVSQPAVWQWLNESKQLPAEHVLAVEAATNVPRHELRPDIYPRGLQDGVPFTSGEGVGAIGELATGSSPEWPLAPADAGDAEKRGAVFQAPEHSLSGGQASTAFGDETQSDTVSPA